MYIELHMLQNFVPANLNRDDTGNPKDCLFGNYRRARISSQCFKRAIRECPSFDEETGVEQGLRTRNLVHILARELDDSEENRKKIVCFVEKFYAGMDKKKPEQTEVLVYVSRKERELICGKLKEIEWDPGDEKKCSEEVAALAKELVKTVSRHFATAPDIALFGRMLASAPELNVEAACQVAHAISTNAVKMEMDFYTAREEEPLDSNTGAGMMGFTSFNSACFYRYARIHCNALEENLADKEIAAKTVRAFLRSAVEAVPTGKQNAMAAHNPPGFIMAVVRGDGMGWNLANAFEKPIRPTNNMSLTDKSTEALLNYYKKLESVYEGDIREVFIINNTEFKEPGYPEKVQVLNNLSSFISKVSDKISEQEL